MKWINKVIIIALSIFVIGSSVSSQKILPVSINAYAPIGHHFQGNNKYSSIVTYNGYIYVFSMDTLRRPYINKIDETNSSSSSSSSIETVLIDKDKTYINRFFTGFFACLPYFW